MPRFMIDANIIFTYYDDLARAADFYARVLGLPLVVDQGWTKIFQMTPTTFIGCVDGTRGTHKPSKDKPVNISFVTDELEQWYAHLQAHGVTIFRPLKAHPEIGIRGFMALDPEGYVLEFEQFMPSERNARILELLQAAARAEEHDE